MGVGGLRGIGSDLRFFLGYLYGMCFLFDSYSGFMLFNLNVGGD